jgi:hypothetical protein
MKKIVRLTERDLTRLVKRVIIEDIEQRDNPLSSLLNVYVEYKNNNIHFTVGWNKYENYFTIRFPNLKADYEEIDANYIMISKDIEMAQRVFEYLKDYVEEILCQDCDPSRLVHSYALAFLGDVNWYEIAQHFVDDFTHDMQEEERAEND